MACVILTRCRQPYWAPSKQKPQRFQFGGARRGQFGELQSIGDVFTTTYLIRMAIGGRAFDQQINHNNNVYLDRRYTPSYVAPASFCNENGTLSSDAGA
jgi:hypothetical protein